LILQSIVVALVLGGCKNRPAEPPKPEASTVDAGTLPAEEPLPFKALGSRLAGTLDVRNRYASTVLVETRAPRKRE